MKRNQIEKLMMILLLCIIQAAGMAVYGQDRPRAAARRQQTHLGDSIQQAELQHNQQLQVSDSIAAENRRKMKELTDGPRLTGDPNLTGETIATDSLQRKLSLKTFIPNPVKATWLALLIPGAGQIYNRKYWKLPIVYGGFAGCAYALTWNGNMYKDYSNAYKDAVNENWSSTNITDLLPPGYISRVSKTQLTETLRRRKDMYRRYRDLSIFATIGVYLISVIDAYVDAELSNFDISPDLSMKIEPTVIPNHATNSGVYDKSIGVQCSFRF